MNFIWICRLIEIPEGYWHMSKPVSFLIQLYQNLLVHNYCTCFTLSEMVFYTFIEDFFFSEATRNFTCIHLLTVYYYIP
jgi:hypothetical protein